LDVGIASVSRRYYVGGMSVFSFKNNCYFKIILGFFLGLLITFGCNGIVWIIII
jgi:hypothetical protein